MSRTRIIGRKEVLALLASPKVLISVSYGLNTTVHLYHHGDPALDGTVRFDTFLSLKNDREIMELPHYKNQPGGVERYTLSSATKDGHR